MALNRKAFLDTPIQKSVEETEPEKSWFESAADMASNAVDMASNAVDAIENEYDYVSNGIKNNLEWLGSGFNGEMSDFADAMATIRDTPLVKLPEALSDTLAPAVQNIGYALGRDIMKAAEDGSDVAQYIATSNAYNTYLMSPEDKIKKAEEIEAVTHIKTSEILNDSDAYKAALSIYTDAKKAQNVMGDKFTMDEVWKQYPTLQNIAELSPEKAALVLHDFGNYKNIHGTIEELWEAGWDLGFKRLEYGNLKYKEMNGEATDEDKKRMERLKPQIETASQREPNFYDDVLGYALHGVGTSLPEMIESMHEGANAAAITAAAGIVAGGAIGAAPGAAVGGTGGAMLGFAKGFLGNVIRKHGFSYALKFAGMAGMTHGIYKPETGNYYDEYSNMKDSNGKKLLTDEQASYYAKEAGAANALIETVSLGTWASAGANAFKASSASTKVFQEGVQALIKKQAAGEALKSQRKEIIKNTFSATAKGMFSESAEEATQTFAEDIVHNQIERDTNDKANGGVYSNEEMLAHAGKSFAAALPASFVMGAVPNAFGGGAGMYHSARSGRILSTVSEKYGANALQTILGARLLGQLQEQVQNSYLKDTSPETVNKIIRDEAAGSGYEWVYVDVPSILERENGKEDLQKIAEAANLSDEELQTAVNEGGNIAMPLESYAQSGISEEALESVSFSKDAESIAEMKRNAVADAEAMQAEQDKLVELQMKLYDNIPQHYFPEDENAQNVTRTAITYNPYNPAEGLRTYKAQLEQEYYDIINPALNALQENAGAKNGGGVEVVVIDDDGRGGRGYKVSNNAPWYSKFYQENGRAPTKAEMNKMAEDLTVLSPSMVDVAGWMYNVSDLSPEEQGELQQTTANLERIKQELADIDRVKTVISKLDKTEVEMIERLSPEGLQVYQEIKKSLQQFGGKVGTAGRVSAILTARHADLYAAAMRKNGNENYTALDWYKRMSIGNEEIEGAGYNQPVHPSVDLNQKYEVLDLDALDNHFEGMSDADIVREIKKLGKGKVYNEGNLSALIGMPLERVGYDHMVMATLYRKKHNDRDAHIKTLSNIDKIIQHAVFVEVSPNLKKTNAEKLSTMGKRQRTKASRKNKVQAYYRFVVPVKIHNQLKTVTLVAENFDGKISLDTDMTHLYELEYTAQKSNTLPPEEVGNNPPPSDGTQDVAYEVTIPQMLNGVKDSLKKDFINEDGSVNIGMYLPNGDVVYFNDKNGSVNVENSFSQLAGIRSKGANLDSLARAQAMAADKENYHSPEDIYKETGWLKGADGKWRYEIPDNLEGIKIDDFLKAGNLASWHLERLYDNPALYKAYPQLRKIPIELATSLPKGVVGRTNPIFGTIEINYNYATKDPDKAKSALVHEIQHLIQEEEDFARGGSYKTVRDDLRAELKNINDELNKDGVEDYLSATQKADDAIFSFDEEEIEKWGKIAKEKENNLIKLYGEGFIEKVNQLSGRKASIIEALTKDEYTAYRNLAGEQEAREAEKRAKDRKEVDKTEKEYKEALADYTKLYEKADKEIQVMADERNRLQKEAETAVDNGNDAEELFDKIYEIDNKILALGENGEEIVIAMQSLDFARHDYETALSEHGQAMPQPHDQFDAIVIFGGNEFSAQQESLNQVAVYDELEIQKMSRSFTHSAFSSETRQGLRGPALFKQILAGLIQKVNTSNAENDSDSRQKAIEKIQQIQDVLFQQTNARTTFMSDGSRIVSIFQSADESSFIHEMSHIFLKDLEELAKLDKDHFKQLEAVNEWANWDKESIRMLEGSSWYKEFVGYHNTIMDAEAHGDIQTAETYKAIWRQERFARGFEMYLRSGDAPVKGLRKVFRDFKRWLISIYSAFIGADKGAAPSAKVKAVMDRMVASEEEIKAAALDERWKDVEKAGGEKLFNETEEETYQRLLEEAKAEAEEKLMKFVMEDMEKKSREELEIKVQTELERVAEEMEKVPVYIATEAYKRTGDKDIVLQWYPSWEDYRLEADSTEPLAEAMKEYETNLRNVYEQELIEKHLTEADIKKAMESSEYYTKRQQMEAVAFTRKMKAVRRISTKAKLAMQNVADMLDELPDNFNLQEDVTDQRVKDLMEGLNKLRFSEKWESDAFPIIKNMVNAATKEKAKEEFQKFNKLVQRRKVNEKMVEEATAGRINGYKASAKDYVSKVPLSEACDYIRHIRNQKTMAYRMQTALKSGHYDLAIKYKQSMAYSAALADESKKMQERLSRLLKKVNNQLKTRFIKLPKDERYWHAHLAYLLRITSEDVPVPESGVVDLAKLYQSMVDSLDLQYVPTDIINLATSEDFKGYRSMTIGEFEEAVEALTILYTTGKGKFSMKTIGGKSLADVVEEITGVDTITGRDYTLAANIRSKRHTVADDEGGLGYLFTLGKIPVIGEKMAQFGPKTLGAIISPENILDIMGDAAKKYIGGIYAKAGDVERTKQVEAVESLQKILARYTKKERAEWKKKKYTLNIEGDKQLLSKENILCMALNYGNETNWRRLTASFNDIVVINGVKVFGRVTEVFMFENMSKRDWEFVQDIWDFLDSYWKETVEIEEKLNGVALQKVEPREFSVKPNDSKEKITLQGGYYPIKYNPAKSAKAGEQSDVTEALRSISGAQVLGIGRGFTKARSDADVGRPLLLEFGVIEEHVQAVIHNIAYRLAARDVYRIVSSKGIEERIRNTIGANYHKVLKEWATDVWATTKDNNNSANSWLEGAVHSLRTNSVMAIMGYRLWPVIENVSNIAVVMDKVGYLDGARAVIDYYKDLHEGLPTYGPLLQKSSFMSNRMNSMDRDIGSRSDLFNTGHPVIDLIKEHAYWLMTKSDLMLSAPLWVKVYKENIKNEMKKAFEQNEKNKKEFKEAQNKLDNLKKRRYDITKIISQIDEEKHNRSIGILNPDSPFAIYQDYELSSQKREYREKVNSMRKEIWEAEVMLNKAAELEILSDNEVIERADRNAVLLADKAIKLSFGSGETQDLSSIQRSRSELTKLLTTFYSFFNTQFNAVLNEYLHAKYEYGHADVNGWKYFKYYAPVARAYFNRVILASLIGSLLKMALSLDGDDEKDKYKKVKNEDGKEVKQEIPWSVRLAKVLAKNVAGTTFGAVPVVRDISNYAISNVFDGTDYGRGMSFGSTGIKGLESTAKLVKMVADKSEHNLKIEEKHKKEQERFNKMTPTAKKKWLEGQKYKKPEKPIENTDIIKAAVNTASTFTAARTGITNTLVDAVTTTIQYINSSDRYDTNLQNIIWSALFDKKAKEKTVPEKPATPPKKKKK